MTDLNLDYLFPHQLFEEFKGQSWVEKPGPKQLEKSNASFDPEGSWHIKASSLFCFVVISLYLQKAIFSLFCLLISAPEFPFPPVSVIGHYYNIAKKGGLKLL